MTTTPSGILLSNKIGYTLDIMSVGLNIGEAIKTGDQLKLWAGINDLSMRIMGSE